MKNRIQVGVILALTLAGLATGLIFAWIKDSKPKPFEIPADEIPAARVAHRWLASAGTMPISDSAGVVATFRHAERLPNQIEGFEPSAEMQTDLFRMLAKWLDYRARADIDGYEEWMKSRGYSLALSDLSAKRHFSMQDWDIQNAWKVYTKSDAPRSIETIDPEQFFRIAFEKSLAMKNGFLRGVRISEKAQVLYQAIPITRLDTRPGGLEDWPEGDYWVGNAVSGDRPHWRPPVTYGDVLRRDGAVFVAIVFLGAQSQAGEWVPMCICSYYDLAAQEWHIESVTYSNALYRGLAVER